MSQRPIKRSVTLKGHRTSVSLEDAFWDELQRLAAAQGQPLNTLIAQIDAERKMETNLASALRLYVLRKLRKCLP